METLDDSEVEGQPECESVVQRAVECQQGMTEDEEVVTQDGEDTGEVSREERNVLKADPGVLKLYQQHEPSLAKA